MFGVCGDLLGHFFHAHESTFFSSCYFGPRSIFAATCGLFGAALTQHLREATHVYTFESDIVRSLKSEVFVFCSNMAKCLQ